MSTSPRTIRGIVFAVTAAAAVIGLAGPVELRAANGLANSDFDSGIAGWAASDGALAWNGGLDVNSCTSSGAAVASTPDFVAGKWTVTVKSSGSCVPVTPGSLVWMRARVLFSAAAASTDLGLLGYSDANCSAGEVELPIAGYGPLPLIWLDFALGITVDGATHSARFFIRTADPTVSTYSWSLDRAYLGVGDPVLLDDFGAAATCRWSATVP